MCGSKNTPDGAFWEHTRNGARSGENGAVTYGCGEKNISGQSLAGDKPDGLAVLRKLAHDILRGRFSRTFFARVFRARKNMHKRKKKLFGATLPFA